MNITTEIVTWAKASGLMIEALTSKIIFIVRNKAIGDVLWMEPVIRKIALKANKIFVVTSYPEIFENYPLTQVHFINRADKKYKRCVKLLKLFGQQQHIIDLDNAYEKDTQKHFLHAYQIVAKIQITNEYPVLYLNESEKKQFASHNRYVVLHIESFSVWNYRNVYGINWQTIVYFLYSIGYETYVIAKYPVVYAKAKYIATDLRDLIALIYNAALFIGIDSGPGHIAASLKIPSIIFFGAVNPWFRHFKDQFNGIIMQQPCEYAGCYHREKENISGRPCLLVGDEGIPKCSLHQDSVLINNIKQLLSES